MRWFDRRSAACVALLCVLVMAGCGGSTATSNVTATPSFSPSGGTYNTTQSVTIADTTPGAVLYCTTDGTQPTISSSKCSQPTVISKSMYLQAIAVASGKTASAVASAGFTIDLNAAATPTFSPVGGTYTAAQTVTISETTSGAQVYYTTDGTTPTTSSTLYTGPITVSSSQTLRAIAVATGYNDSGVASTSYVINYPAATPVISLASGTYTSVQAVTITDATPGATIYYTTDTSIPSATNGKVYSAPITVSSSQTIAAVAVASGYASSPVASATYTINLDAATPTFAINGVTLGASTTVNAPTSLTFNDTPANATIYYTLDGKTPSASYNSGSITSGNSITVNPPTDGTTSVTVNADAVSASGVLSSMASVTLNFQTTAPTFSIGGTATTGGRYTLPQTVSISDTTSNATTYYYFSADNSTPPSDLSKWTQGSSATVTTPGTLWAVATGTGYAQSTQASAQFEAELTITGKVLSGTTAISGAQVYLYQAGGNASTAGSTAYGTGAALVSASPSSGVKTSTDGSFTLTYGDSCPASPDDQLFLVATGGTVVGGSDKAANGDIAFMTALGTCSALGNTKTVVVNEATTVASVWALQQFMKADTSIEGGLNIGTSSGNYQGLANAFATVGNLVDVSTGNVWGQTVSGSSIPYGLPSDGSVTWHTTGSVGMTPAYAKGVTPTRGTDGTLCSTTTSTTYGCNTTFKPVQYMNDSTVPTARIDTLANMLAFCVDAAANCQTLSTDTATGTLTPDNTLKAAFNMAKNPGGENFTNNGGSLSTLWTDAVTNNTTTSTLYQPALSTQPSDLTLALSFTSGGLGGLPVDYSTKVVVANGIDMDAAGNIYAVGVGNSIGTIEYSSLIAKFSNLGVPASAPTTYDASSVTAACIDFSYSCGGYTYGGVTTLTPNSAAYIGQSPQSVAIDLNGTAWIGNFQGLKKFDNSLYDMTDGSGVTSSGGGAAASSLRSMAFDAYNTLWSDRIDNTSPTLYQLTSGDTVAASYTPEGNTSVSNLGGLAFDAKGNLWAQDSSNTALLRLTTGTASSSPAPYSLPYGTTGVGSRVRIGADSSGNIYFCSAYTATSVTSATATAALATYNSGTTLKTCGQSLMVDGDGYLWSVYAGARADRTTSPLTTGHGTITKMKYDGTNLNLLTSTPYTGTSSGEANLLFTTAMYYTTGSLAGAQIDSSGNLWVMNSNIGNGTATTYLTGNMLVEFVGLAAPLNTPVSYAVQQSTAGAAYGGIGQRP